MNNETPASVTSDGARQSDACEEAIAYAKRTCHDVDVQAEHVETFLAGYDALRARILAAAPCAGCWHVRDGHDAPRQGVKAHAYTAPSWLAAILGEDNTDAVRG